MSSFGVRTGEPSLGGMITVGSEATMAGQWRAEFKPGERSLRDLIADIFTLEAKYRRDAIAFLRKHASTSDKHTACIMWRLDGTCNRSTAGGRHDVSNLRTAHGVFLGKDTVCAEESFLVKHGT